MAKRRLERSLEGLEAKKRPVEAELKTGNKQAPIGKAQRVSRRRFLQVLGAATVLAGVPIANHVLQDKKPLSPREHGNDNLDPPDFVLSDEKVDFLLPQGQDVQSLREGYSKFEGDLKSSYQQTDTGIGGIDLMKFKDIIGKQWAEIALAEIDLNSDDGISKFYHLVNSYLLPLGYFCFETNSSFNKEDGSIGMFVSIASVVEAKWAVLNNRTASRKVLVLDLAKDVLSSAPDMLDYPQGFTPSQVDVVALYPESISKMVMDTIQAYRKAGIILDCFEDKDLSTKVYMDIMLHELTHADDMTRFPAVSRNYDFAGDEGVPIEVEIPMGHNLKNSTIQMQDHILGYTELGAFGAQILNSRLSARFNLLYAMHAGGIRGYDALNRLLPNLIVKHSPESREWQLLIEKIRAGGQLQEIDFLRVIASEKFTDEHAKAVGADLFRLGRLALEQMENDIQRSRRVKRN